MNDFADIPVLDLTPLIEGGDISALTSEFAKAYGKIGYAYVINQGIDREASQAGYDAHQFSEAQHTKIAENSS